MKYNQGFTLLLVLIVVLGVITAGGITYFSKKTDVTSNSDASCSIIDPPAEWKEYNYKTIVFSYPSTWTIKEYTTSSQDWEGEETETFPALKIIPPLKKLCPNLPKKVTYPEIPNYEFEANYDIDIDGPEDASKAPQFSFEPYYPIALYTNGIESTNDHYISNRVHFRLGNGYKYLPELKTIFDKMLQSVRVK